MQASGARRRWLVLSLLVAGAGCRITPDEIRAIEAENELLRQEIHTVKENCTYYRELDLEADEPATEPR